MDDSDYDSSSQNYSDESYNTKLHSTKVIPSRGLKNYVNTCFMNAATQCMVHTVDIAKHMLVQMAIHQEMHRCGEDLVCNECFFRSLFQIPFGSDANPVGLLERFPGDLGFFADGKEHDSHEFLMALINIAENNFDMQEICSGSKRLTDVCEVGHVEAKEPESFASLILNVGPSNNIIKALDDFAKEEELHVFCKDCNKRSEKMRRKTLIVDSPPVLIFVVNRSLSDEGNEDVNQCELPLEFDISPFVEDHKRIRGRSVYQLSSVIVHDEIGDGKGHYWCYVRFGATRWKKFDDMEVTNVREDSVVLCKPRVLIFTSPQTEWFSGFYFSHSNENDPITLFKTAPNDHRHPLFGERINSVFRVERFLTVKKEFDGLLVLLNQRADFLEDMIRLEGHVDNMGTSNDSLQKLNASMKIFLEESQSVFDSFNLSKFGVENFGKKGSSFTPYEQKLLVFGVRKYK